MIRPPTGSGGCMLPLIGYMFLLFGVVLTAVGGFKVIQARASNAWPMVQGTVLTSTVEKTESRSTRNVNRNRKRRSLPPVKISTEDRSKKSTSYQAAVTYGYTVEGVEHVGNRIVIGAVSSNKLARAEELVGRYPEGGEVQVHYDPEDPGSSVLEPGVHGGAYFLPVIGLIFLLLGGGITVVRRKMRAAPAQE